MQYDGRGIANFVLDRADSHGLGLTNLHINKIIYFAHGRFLALQERPLIAQQFEAWEHGPVVQDLYHQFKKYGSDVILGRANRLNRQTAQYEIAPYKITSEDAEILAPLVEFYMRIPALVLSNWSHKKGSPWYRTWHYNDRSNPGMVIPNELIAAWFTSENARETEV